MSRVPLISIRNLTKTFARSMGLLGEEIATYAVRNVDLDVMPGTTMGIVGESGCGKSTLGRMAVGLLKPDSGDVLIEGRALHDHKAHKDYRAFRKSLAGMMQMIFQDPYSSLNPRMRVGESVAEPLVCSVAWQGRFGAIAGQRRKPGRSAIQGRVSAVLAQVGMDADAARRYPHEFSGGQRQRIAIARALATRPDFVVCDEPTSSLDVSVQAQVLNLLLNMQRDMGLTYLFISHDLAVVRHMSDKVAVMYQGVIVEEGAVEQVFKHPRHPYTHLLLESVAGIERKEAHTQDKAAPSFFADNAGKNIDGNAASYAYREVTGKLKGCPFAPRCPVRQPICGKDIPSLLTMNHARGNSAPHRARCFFPLCQKNT